MRWAQPSSKAVIKDFLVKSEEPPCGAKARQSLARWNVQSYKLGACTPHFSPNLKIILIYIDKCFLTAYINTYQHLTHECYPPATRLVLPFGIRSLAVRMGQSTSQMPDRPLHRPQVPALLVDSPGLRAAHFAHYTTLKQDCKDKQMQFMSKWNHQWIGRTPSTFPLSANVSAEQQKKGDNAGIITSLLAEQKRWPSHVGLLPTGTRAAKPREGF